MTEQNLIKEFKTHIRVYESSGNVFDLQLAEEQIFKLMEIKGIASFEEAYDYAWGYGQ